MSYRGEDTCLFLGNGNTIREYVTINLGTIKGGGTTRIGDNNLLMAYVHIAHDCKIGNRVVIANASHFAGHVTVEDQSYYWWRLFIHSIYYIGSTLLSRW